MQKKLIALAVAGLASTAAFAQTNVTIYGVADVGVEWANSKDGAGTQFRVQSGQQSGSRLGFKGEEALGNGLKAIFTLEMGFALDNGQTTTHGANGGDVAGANVNAAGYGNAAEAGFNQGQQVFQRQAFAGLSHAKYGTATVGRQYTPFYATKLVGDAFGLGLGGTNNNLFGFVPGNTDRLNNSVAYTSPNWSGFSFQGVYTSGDENNIDTVKAAGNRSERAGKGYALGAYYSNGPLNLAAAYHDVYTVGTIATGTTIGLIPAGARDVPHGKAWTIAGNYDFKVVKVFAQYADGKAKTSGLGTTAEGSLWSIGASVPFGAHTVMVQYTDADNDLRGASNRDSKLWGLGYSYALSKRTNLYASYSKLNNDRLVGTDINSAISNGLNAGNGSDPTSFMLGARHTF